jgi:hypothetical protein
LSWATHYISELQQGRTVQFRPRGNSMVGKISSGQLCTVAPISADVVLEVGDIVLCAVGRSQYLHLIKAIREDRFLIGNNRGGVNGWVPASKLYGRCIRVEP